MCAIRSSAGTDATRLGADAARGEAQRRRRHGSRRSGRSRRTATGPRFTARVFGSSARAPSKAASRFALGRNEDRAHGPARLRRPPRRARRSPPWCGRDNANRMTDRDPPCGVEGTPAVSPVPHCRRQRSRKIRLRRRPSPDPTSAPSPSIAMRALAEPTDQPSGVRSPSKSANVGFDAAGYLRCEQRGVASESLSLRPARCT
jgi:hypothetical protein